MKITILTLFPQMIEGFFAESIVKRAIGKKLVEINIIDLRKFAVDEYGTVDDKPYGGGVGMVMRVDVVEKALRQIHVMLSAKRKTVITSPKGDIFNQKKAKEYAQLDHLIVVAGHYEGIDERVSAFVDEEISLGDFVMTGGEIAAAGIVDSVVRLIPGVLKKEDAVNFETFMKVSIDQLEQAGIVHDILDALKKKGITEVQLLEYPHYTRPEEYKGKKVPHVLLSGNHSEIEKWRLQKAFEETLKKRADLLRFNI